MTTSPERGVEETHNTREWEDRFSDLTKGYVGTDFEGNEYTLWDVCYDHDKDKRAVAEMIADFIHQELQKARHDWLREEIVKLEGMKEEVVGDLEMNLNIKKLSKNKALQTIIDRYQSELDQPTVFPEGCDGDKIYTKCPFHSK